MREIFNVMAMIDSLKDQSLFSMTSGRGKEFSRHSEGTAALKNVPCEICLIIQDSSVFARPVLRRNIGIKDHIF